MVRGIGAVGGHPAVMLRPLARNVDPLAGDRLIAGVVRDRLHFADRLGIAVRARAPQAVFEAQLLVQTGIDDLADADIRVEQVGAFERGPEPDDRAPAVADQHQLVLAEPLAHVLGDLDRSEEHTSELPSLMRISYAVYCLKKKITQE